MKDLARLLLLTLLLFVVSHLVPVNCFADHQELLKGKKVFIVASYHFGYKWVEEIVSTLKMELAGADLTFFYMDTKRNYDGAAQKGQEAYELYQQLNPDAVITMDDNAQAFFVVPYLKDKVDTPVFFCAVNDDAGKYGFPAKNVTGVLEKKHYRESISFAQILNPKVQKVAVLFRPTPSNEVNVGQINSEKESYTAEIVAYYPVNTKAEVDKALEESSRQADALILLNMSGIVDEKGKIVEGHEAISYVAGKTHLVTIGASNWEVEAGALCGVIKTGEEQGTMVSSQLISYFEGKDLKDIPLLQNINGQRYINFETLKKLNLDLQPEMVIGTKIVTGNK